MNKISLRKMTAEEYSKYVAFSYESFIRDMAQSSNQSIEEIQKKVGPPPSSPADHDLWYLAESNEKPIGFFWIQLRAEGKAFGYDIYLDEDYRGKGLGRSVMLEGRKLLKKYNVTTLEICVFDANQTARNLYASLGFTEVQAHPDKRQRRLQIII